MIDDTVFDDDVDGSAVDDDIRNGEVDDPSSLNDDDGYNNYDDFAVDSGYDDGSEAMELELELLKRQFRTTPDSEALPVDAKPVPTAIRGASSGSSLLDPFGTGELFDDESSAAASVVVLGLLLVIIVLACVYASFRQSMDVTPTHKNGASKQGKEAIPSLSKRRE